MANPPTVEPEDLNARMSNLLLAEELTPQQVIAKMKDFLGACARDRTEADRILNGSDRSDPLSFIVVIMFFYGDTARFNARWEIWDLLLQAGMDIHRKDRSGRTLLHTAANGSHELVKHLCSSPQSLDHTLKNTAGDTALDIANRVKDNTDEQQSYRDQCKLIVDFLTTLP
jgi:hypothetical protein